MNAHSDSAGPTETADDPEIEALLLFDPVPRKIKRGNSWTPALQRRFIAHLAATGSPSKAVAALGKDHWGIEKLYRAEGAESFRAAWDRAIEISEERRAAQQEAQNAQWSRVRPPAGVDKRLGARPAAAPFERDYEVEPGVSDLSDEYKRELLYNLGIKFMRKVAAEREARLNGEIVAADFYLRQVTFLEATFDLTATDFGWDAHQALSDLRRGEYGIMDIVSTPLADWLDRSRRLWWAQEGEPERPPHPDVRFLQRHRTEEGECSTYVEQHATGATSTPARGYSAEAWADMDAKAQIAARQKQFDADAAEQIRWERHAHEANFRARAGAEGANE
jgi:hypothetical protein